MQQASKVYLPVRIELPNVDELKKLAALLIESGCFADTKGIAQAVIKIMAGAEYGFTPYIAMKGIHIIQGQPTLSANLIAACIKRYANGVKYKMRVIEKSHTRCAIEFIEDGEPVGVQEFTVDDARQAELMNKDNWRKYTRAMLYARCVSEGARTYCQDVFGGPVYSPEDFDVVVDAEESKEVSKSEPAPKEPVKRSKSMPTLAQSAEQLPPSQATPVAATAAADASGAVDAQVVDPKPVVAESLIASASAAPQAATSASLSDPKDAPLSTPGTTTPTATPGTVTDPKSAPDAAGRTTAPATTETPTNASGVSLDDLKNQIRTIMTASGYLVDQFNYFMKEIFQISGLNQKAKLPEMFEEICEFFKDASPYPGQPVRVENVEEDGALVTNMFPVEAAKV